MSEPEWLIETRKRRFPWATDAQWECLRMLSDLVNGFHHLFGKIHADGQNDQIRCILEAHNCLATYDYRDLTRLVVMAHDRCIRAEIQPAGRSTLTIILTKRSREGSQELRHPTLEENVTKIREDLAR